MLRRKVALLADLQGAIRRGAVQLSGPWPQLWRELIGRLRRVEVILPEGSVAELGKAIAGQMQAARRELHALDQACRAERSKRWRQALPRMWQERPGALCSWLRADSPPWGTAPILDEHGMQCLTVAAVDRAVQQCWVDSIFRCHADMDGVARWATFTSSRFGEFIPQATWQRTPWTAERVKLVLATMREAAAPGALGVPIAVWRALPESWAAAVARLLGLVEAERRWPSHWLNAYVTMIPKASGGSRPEDQRPITVLELLYRVWAKGITLEWRVVLQRNYLGDAAMGFRAEAGTKHMVQLLTDLIAVQQRRKAELFFASFDLWKAYDTIPWWAVFGVMRRTGVAAEVVDCFEDYARRLRRQFRYGAVDGECWQAANGLPQGCPASPDELNFLLEAFHRWARARGLGVNICMVAVPSTSFADDVVLIGRCQAEIEALIEAYLEWCQLLALTVTKVQVWWNGQDILKIRVGQDLVPTVPVFKVVGVILGLREAEATALHLTKRLPKALATVQRLRGLDVPASLAALLWKTTVLPQALYGCEVRAIGPKQVSALAAAGRAMLATKAPLQLNSWRAPEVITGPAFGDTALLDPMADVRRRQLSWLHLLVNLPGLVGAVHRDTAWQNGVWVEPTAALRGALMDVGWTVRRNVSSARASRWPLLDPEPAYPGEVQLTPQDVFPMAQAVFTDGSVCQCGGAAALQPDTDQALWAQLPKPRSSTQCELAALCLAMGLNAPLVLTDSLTALQMVRGWSSWSPARVLRCPDRAEVRRLLHFAAQCAAPPRLEKVKAHNDDWLQRGHPMAVGNDQVDALAKRAAMEDDVPAWPQPAAVFCDPVELVDGSGAAVDVSLMFGAAWWQRCRRRRKQPRRWLAELYRDDMPIAWDMSNYIFRRPVVTGTSFVHPVAPAVIKWVARIRAGCLATRLRLFERHLIESPACQCCGEAEEDDVHVVSGCWATGTGDWLALVAETWQAAASSTKVMAPLPPAGWLQQHRLQLMAALVPASLTSMLQVPVGDACRMLRRLHFLLAEAVAERLRRREVLQAEAASAAGPSDGVPRLPGRALVRPCPLPPERQLTVLDLRRLEVQGRGTPPSAGQHVVAVARVPPSGEPRRRWLRRRLVQLLQEDMDVCPAAVEVNSEALVEYFERVTGELFSASPGVSVLSRVSGMGRTMNNVEQQETFVPVLQRHIGAAGRVWWNRQPRGPRVDIATWRRRAEAAEAVAAPVPRLRGRVADANEQLMTWVRQHRALVPAGSDEPVTWESGMALLLLWEIDHGCSRSREAGMRWR